METGLQGAEPFCTVWTPFTLSERELQVREREHMKVTTEPAKVRAPGFGGEPRPVGLLGGQAQPPAATSFFIHLLL